jgi:hypothetical protein
VRQSRLSLRAAGLLIGLASVALIAFQPSDPAGAAGLPTGRQTGSAGATAAQVGSRLVIDNLSESAASRSRSSHPSAGGALTIALASLHLPAPAHPAAPLRSAHPATPVPPVPVAVPATTVPTPTPVPTPAPTTPAPTAPAGPLAPSAAIWAELRECESGDNYAIDTGNGYYGAYQFSASTWVALGYPGLPNQAPPAVQDQAAQRLEAMSGWGQWPGCSAKLGL